jgi:hypothetical protein
MKMSKEFTSIIDDLSIGEPLGATGRGMPNIARTTTTAKEFAPKPRVYETKFFAINSDEDACVYSSFMNWLISDRQNRTIIREESSWTKEGELIRVVDFVRLVGDPYPEGFNVETMIRKQSKEEDITREPENTTSPSIDAGQRFSSNDYVEG